MKIFLKFLLICFIISSCHKREIKTKVLHNFNDVNEMFQLKNYKNQLKKNINDSTIHIIAKQDYFILNGNFDTKNNVKKGIWSLKNKNDSKEIQIDYIVFGKNDAFENQIIFKEHRKIDSSNSKFYLVENKNLQGLSYKFFSPKMKDEVYKEAKIIYSIYRNRKEIKIDSVVYKNMQMKQGKYLADLRFEFKKGDHVSGYFTEYVSSKINVKSDSVLLGSNTIYFIEKFE